MYQDIDTRDLLSEAKFFEGYSRWDDEKNRYETWEEAVERVMNMHREYFADRMSDELSEIIDKIEDLYKKKYFLGAQRALQFGGEQLLKNSMRLYNCTSSYADRAEFFGEYFWILLSGAGAGFSVQWHHIESIPTIQNRTKQAKIHVIEDSIEGWATAADVLLSSYFVGGGKHPEFEGRRVFFDTTQIRPKGAKISGGFKAPGPEPLRRALDKIEYLLQGLILSGKNKLRPIHVYDICMHLADAVLSGGVRRAATICLFSPDDEEMINAKTGDWYITNPQRARSNNSALFVRSETSFDLFMSFIAKIKQFGEPGFVFAETKEACFNPCVTGDTLVWVKDHDIYQNGKKIAEGSVYQIPVKMLAEKYEEFEKSNTSDIALFLPLVLSKNLETDNLEFKQILWGKKTRENANLVKVTCEKTGKSIRCTLEHKIWTKNRGWVEAKDLKDEDELDIK